MLAARANVCSTSSLAARPSAASARERSRGALVVTAASKKKDVRLQVTLECTEQKESGVQGMSRYMTQKVSDDAGEREAKRARAGRAPRPARDGAGRRGMGRRDDLRVSGRRTDGGALVFDSQNRRNTSQRLELMKYNPFLQKHTLHRELKK
jgi:ribosomal protein L33